MITTAATALQSTAATDIDRYVYVTGGFTDNISIYCIQYIYPEYHFRYVIKHLGYEAKQNNCGLWKFPFENVVDYDTLSTVDVVLNHKEYCRYKHNKVFRYINYLLPILLHPTTPYSTYCLKVVSRIRNRGYSIIGIRWRYPFIKYGNKTPVSLVSLSESVEAIERKLHETDRVVLMFDDWNYIETFVVMFYDLLIDKHIITLKSIDVNSVHDLYNIAKHCSDIVYTNCSRFYQIIEYGLLHVSI